MSQSSNYRRDIVIARVTLFALPFLIVVLAVYQDINPSGMRSFSAHIGTPAAMISALFPEQRLDAVSRSAGQRIREQPVYFTVRYPHRYDTARVRVNLSSDHTVSWRIGIAVQGASDWSYRYATPDQLGSAAFDLTNAQVSDGALRFIIATPDNLAMSKVQIQDIAVVLSRESLLNTLWRRL